MDLVVMTCDAYQDTWEAFFRLKDKYWANCPYDTYVITETIDCPYANTIKTTGAWTKRLREALEQLDSEHIIFMLDDFFLRSKVDQDRIDTIIKHFKDDTAVFNFELRSFLPCHEDGLIGFKRRKNKTSYLNSCQPSIHHRLKLIERLQKDQNPQEWECELVDSKYNFYVNSGNYIIDIGYRHQPLEIGWGITRGKLTDECKRFLAKEGFDIEW